MLTNASSSPAFRGTVARRRAELLVQLHGLLIAHANRDELIFHLWQIETHRMGLSSNRQRTEATADRLIELRDKMDGGQS